MSTVVVVVGGGWKSDGGAIGLPGLAVGDVDGDGDLDVFLTATGENGAGVDKKMRDRK